jgi:hypothetical protein
MTKSWYLVLIALLMLAPCVLAASPGRRPNVLFIITDDQSLDSFGFIKHKALTPKMS